MEESRVPFGLKAGRLYGVDEVARGAECDCVCPKCLAPLWAKKGEINVYHFSHAPGIIPCANGTETAIHQMAKQILLEVCELQVPEIVLIDSLTNIGGGIHRDTEVVVPESRLRLDSVVLEKAVDDLRPDVLADVNGRYYLVEIIVSNPIDDEKRKKLRDQGHICLVIDLSKCRNEITKAELSSLIIDVVENKKWISYPDVLQAQRKLHDRLVESVRLANNGIKQQRDAHARRRSAKWRDW